MPPAPSPPAIDASGYVRRARRLADLSQRDLAAAVGIAQARIARIETGGSVSLRDFVRILGAAGLRVAIVDSSGRAVAPMPHDVLRDGADRRLPAHLDVYARPSLPTTRQLFRAADPVPRPSWHHHRAERDRLRRRDRRDATDEQLMASAATANRAAARSRRRSPR